MTQASLYQRNMALLAKAGVAYQEYQHEPVLTYQQAQQVRERFAISGSESKSLFLRLKNGRYCMFVTLEGRRYQRGALQAVVGGRFSLASDEELTQHTSCQPLAACPFGHVEPVQLVVDDAVFQAERFIYSPGPASHTLVVEGKDIPQLLAASDISHQIYREPSGE